MPSFFRQFNLLRWLRYLFTRNPKRQSSTTTASSSLNKKNKLRSERTYSIPFSLSRPTHTSILSRKPNKYSDKNKDGWTTIFLDEDKDWLSDSDGSTELRPVILTSEKPPVLPKYVKSVGGVTDFREIVRFQTEESLRRNREEGDILEEISYPRELEVPLAEMNRSSYLFEIVGLDDSEDDEDEYYHNYEQSDGLLRPKPHKSEEDLYRRRSGSSSSSIISIMQRKYEEDAKRRLKYEALHALSARVKKRLELLQFGTNSRLSSSSPTSHSSLTSDGGDFEINLPRSFYRKIRHTSKKSDEVRRSRVYPWMTTLIQDFPIKQKKSQGK